MVHYSAIVDLAATWSMSFLCLHNWMYQRGTLPQRRAKAVVSQPVSIALGTH